MGHVVVALAIDQLVLDRSLVHVFIAGPGYGEGIAVALPERGWILLDGCETRDGALPLGAILSRWRAADDPLDALLLTHPHTDHAYGIREMIEEARPVRIGVTTSTSAPELIFDVLGTPDPSAPPLARRRGRVVIDAMLALRRHLETTRHQLLSLVDGAAVPVSAPGVTVEVRAPDASLVHQRLSAGTLPDPNELSAVIEIAFGATRIVLGSDLPTLDSNARPLAAGWNTVMARHPHLGDHAGLKIPHHGSPAAFHPALMRRGSGRPWWISPFNRGRRLPPTDPDGVPRLVRLNEQVSLTSTPRARDRQPIQGDPGAVTLAELQELFTPTASQLLGSLLVTPPALEPLDPLWCAAFDDQGNLRGAWRGRRAFSVTP